MKILVIDQISQSLDIINLTKEETEQILSSEDMEDQWYESGAILTEHGYFTQEPGLSWMVGDEFPVFVEGEKEPIMWI